ncbi:M24 family metallopeptidase [Anoxybacillus sp. FSL W8-0382]|nr:M24 family metallopeptidase [Anoxybacillus flavithermus]
MSTCPDATPSEGRRITSACTSGELQAHSFSRWVVDEYPSMNATNTMPLQAGMVFTIEPGIYVPSVGGVRIEDDVYMTEKGPLLLTTYPKELQIV